jgi:uncharacterized protein (TIGR02246 family)
MKHLYAIGVVALLTCGCSAPASEDISEPMTQQQAQEFFDRYAELWSAEDLEGWLDLWADDGIIQMPFGAPRVVGRDQLRSHNAATLAGANFVASIKNLDVGSDGDLAYASGVYTMEITPADGSSKWTLDAKYLSVFQRQANGDWLLIRDAFNSNAPLS